MKKNYIELRDDYQLKKGALPGDAKRALKKERDRSHWAYKDFKNKHSNIFRTGALDKEAGYRAGQSVRREGIARLGGHAGAAPRT